MVEENTRIALSSLQQHAVAEMSEEYANGCAKALKRASVTQQPGPDVRHAPFAVLRSTIPGALLELGHLSNASEEKLLKSSSHQDKLVNAIVKSINNYFSDFIYWLYWNFYISDFNIKMKLYRIRNRIKREFLKGGYSDE